jgi:hypothetical protein
MRTRPTAQVPGWRLVNNAAGKQAIRQDWKLKSAEAAQQLQTMIATISQVRAALLPAQCCSCGDGIGRKVRAVSKRTEAVGDGAGGQHGIAGRPRG